MNTTAAAKTPADAVVIGEARIWTRGTVVTATGATTGRFPRVDIAVNGVWVTSLKRCAWLALPRA